MGKDWREGADRGRREGVERCVERRMSPVFVSRLKKLLRYHLLVKYRCVKRGEQSGE